MTKLNWREELCRKQYGHQETNEEATENKMTDKESKNDLRDALVYSADMLSAEHFDFCVHECPSTAIANCADKLTPEQLDYCVRERPAVALEYCADKLTKEQLDYCVHKCPATALLLCAYMLSKEQKKYCEEATK